MNSRLIKRNQSSPRLENSEDHLVTVRPRRLSIQENFVQLKRSISSLRLTPSKSSGEGWDLYGVIIDKEVIDNILIHHYEDPSIKVQLIFTPVFHDNTIALGKP